MSELIKDKNNITNNKLLEDQTNERNNQLETNNNDCIVKLIHNITKCYCCYAGSDIINMIG